MTPSIDSGVAAELAQTIALDVTKLSEADIEDIRAHVRVSFFPSLIYTLTNFIAFFILIIFQ